MSYAAFTKQHYDRSQSFTENGRRISAMWHEHKGSGGTKPTTKRRQRGEGFWDDVKKGWSIATGVTKHFPFVGGISEGINNAIQGTGIGRKGRRQRGGAFWNDGSLARGANDMKVRYDAAQAQAKVQRLKEIQARLQSQRAGKTDGGRIRIRRMRRATR